MELLLKRIPCYSTNVSLGSQNGCWKVQAHDLVPAWASRIPQIEQLLATSLLSQIACMVSEQ